MGNTPPDVQRQQDNDQIWHIWQIPIESSPLLGGVLEKLTWKKLPWPNLDLVKESPTDWCLSLRCLKYGDASVGYAHIRTQAAQSKFRMRWRLQREQNQDYAEWDHQWWQYKTNAKCKQKNLKLALLLKSPCKQHSNSKKMVFFSKKILSGSRIQSFLASIFPCWLGLGLGLGVGLGTTSFFSEGETDQIVTQNTLSQNAN